ncbi:MAG: DUF4136 domain-containing protein [Candidatus Krumholzibacteria bacterium]|nr:DUF4136 domain-containing protein [Candidatus Krumholzibacteria bacterium]
MIFIKRLCVVLLVVPLVGCGSRSYDSHVQIDSQTHPSKDFAGYKTWDFLQYNADLTGMGVLEDADFRLQLGNTIEKAMSDRRFQRVFESPDLHVGYHAAKEAVTEEQLREWYSKQDWELPDVRSYAQDRWEKGQLLLFIFDAKTGEMLWRASAEAMGDDSMPKKDRQALVERAVQQMLDTMPKEKTN